MMRWGVAGGPGTLKTARLGVETARLPWKGEGFPLTDPGTPHQLRSMVESQRTNSNLAPD